MSSEQVVTMDTAANTPIDKGPIDKGPIEKGLTEQDLVVYKTMPVWSAKTLPNGFKEKHNTKEGVWAKLTVLEGALDFAFLTEEGKVVDELIFTPEEQAPLVEPQVWHRISSVSPDILCQLRFLCEPRDYYFRKYGLTPPHSEVVAALKGNLEVDASPWALDVGCGKGRNALYLQQHGWKVTCWDRNAESIQSLATIAQEEKIQENIDATVHDLDSESLPTGPYNLIVNTVVLMFLEPKSVNRVVKEMQQSTADGGYNLIVCAMDSDDYPLSDQPNLPFKFTFKKGQLKELYSNWSILKYNEDVGSLHKTDEHGNPIQLRFATLLAKKISS
ncbi:tellurite resistance protein TehB [Gregarina niphandrodes]|uniref:Tellurite resistance protein TehB n=1 Tax=Gregarina niphandrodes TaxID=110365 RepID=A0A023BA45_GRENI|nr:tellurite resistance protein TehB [Gregarina niphandrodes]EZG77526.1 tellurite resistance protein TehB [Gregarina niphandrodes]|eukprot:XP_011129509.1 tellurite resistance protein TehB [Gregarina niphandrodes]